MRRMCATFYLGKPRGRATTKGKTMTNSEHINEEGKCYCGSLECLGNMRVMAEKLAEENARLNSETATATALLAQVTELKAENERLQNQFDYVSAHVTSWSKRWETLREFFQTSIDNEEWTEDELAEPFWEHLESALDLDLKQTEEIEVRFLVTYEASLTVPKGTDIDDLELTDLASYPDVYVNGVHVGEARWEETETNKL